MQPFFCPQDLITENGNYSEKGHKKIFEVVGSILQIHGEILLLFLTAYLS